MTIRSRDLPKERFGRWMTMLPDLRIPERHRPEYQSAFERGPHERPLRIVIDRQTLQAGYELALNDELTTGAEFEVIGTSETDRLHALVGPGAENGVKVVGPESTTRFSGPDPGTYQSQVSAHAHRYPDRETGAGRDVLLVHLANRSGADLLVTESPGLRSHAIWGSARLAVGLGEALAVIGLFRRSRKLYKTRRRSSEPDVAEYFYRRLAAVHLPSIDMWWAAALASQRGSPENGLPVELVLTINERVARVLRCRDQIQWLTRGPEDSDGRHQVMMFFDVALLMLSGAFDAVAELGNAVYSTGSARPGWRAEGWTKKLGAAGAATTVELMSNGQPGSCLTLVQTLRNTVHGVRLRGRASRTGKVEALVPRKRMDEVFTRLKEYSMEPPALWGIKESRLGPPTMIGPSSRSYRPSPNHPLDELAIDPATFLERLLPGALRSLNDVLSSMDYSRLAGPVIAGAPPDVDPEDATEDARRRVALLGGI